MRLKMQYVADFETTVYEGQESTEVWAAALTSLGNTDPNHVQIYTNIHDFLNILLSFPYNCDIYFHNLKFDGYFILYYLKQQKNWKEGNLALKAELNNFEYKYLISDMGVWYMLTLKYKGRYYRFLDSLKLLPFTVEQIGKSFHTIHQKLSMDYKSHTSANEPITKEESEYIKNDVLVISEALKFMFSKDMTKLTIGSNSLNQYIVYTMKSKENFRKKFPLLEIPIDKFIRKSYKGGFCYLHKPGIHSTGITLDVNSLYPSMMHSISGNVYPYGNPYYFSGDPSKLPKDCYYFIRMNLSFELKPNKIPCIQIKGNPFYPGNEWLTTSTIRQETVSRKYHIDVSKMSNLVELTFTKTDWELVQEQYNIHDLEFLDGYYFKCKSGFFDYYIDYWYELKKVSHGAERELDKLMLNNLYGKFATSPDNNFLQMSLLSNQLVSHILHGDPKESGYIPVGSAITSYSRNFTIRTAQSNYDRFIYSDTDSLHLLGSVNEVVNADISPTELCCWKHENSWDYGMFAGQKRYIEQTGNEYLIRCAGMGKQAQKNLNNLLKLGSLKLEDFKPGFEIEGNLKAYRIDGGRILKDVKYKMR